MRDAVRHRVGGAPSPQVQDKIRTEPDLPRGIVSQNVSGSRASSRPAPTPTTPRADSIEEQTGACWSQTAAFSVGSQQIYTTQFLTWMLLGKEGAY
jgi:hypothetical protein